ncbi:siderophore-interacting protein [Psychromonas marina]|uniref:Siderophore-interacting protein n=1 Tax=Psychromonas marina TaxID=88364 RepID=A0ABQ6E5Q8_9GAMM|nr:siderophore-interacting protein [Psychromonas marina]GLS92460.1 siderophore-interacting protein [Psychromonas marina]
MRPRKPNVRMTHVSQIIELSSHLRRIIVTGDSLNDFPISLEGGYVKVVLPQQGDDPKKMRSYTIRAFDPITKKLELDFVINRHDGPATRWARDAKVGDSIGIAGPGPMKLTHYDHHSYLLIGDLTSMNALNGYIPRFKKEADVRAIIVVPTRSDIIAMDYDESDNTTWFVEDETEQTLAQKVIEVAADMSKDSHLFLGLEAGEIRTLRPLLQEEIGFDRVNISTVGYWKKGVDADRFGAQKKAKPL